MSDPSTQPTPGFSLVIPAWNEEARLERTLERYLPVFESAGRDFEIIVVTDGCTDDTKSVAESKGHRGVRVLEFPHRLGKGAAIFEGLKVAQYDRLGFADADGPVSARDVLQVVAALDQSDCAIASRRTHGSTFQVPRPLMRAVLSRCWNLLVRGMLFLPFGDTQCGVKFLRRSAYLRIRDQTVTFRDWAFDVGLLVLLYRIRQSIAEVPVAWSEEEGSKFNVIRDAPRMFRSLVGIRLMRFDSPKSSTSPTERPAEDTITTPSSKAFPRASASATSGGLASTGRPPRFVGPSVSHRTAVERPEH